MLTNKAVDDMPVSFSPKDISKLLGLSKSFIYNIIGSGDLKHYVIGKRKIILKGDFIEWLSSRERKG